MSIFFRILAAAAIIAMPMYYVSCNPTGNGQEPDPGPGSGSEIDIRTCTVSPNFLDLAKYDVHLNSADTLNGRYVLDFSGDVASIKPGNVLALDADSLGYLVRVKEIAQESGRVTLKAERACLCDVFANTSFILSTSSGVTEETKSSGVHVIHPVSVSYRNADGVLVTEDLSAPTKAVSDCGNIWRDGINYDGAVLWEKGGTYLRMDECHINGSLDMDFYLSFGGFEELERNKEGIIEQYQSNALAMDATLIGSVSIASVIHFHTEGNFNTREGRNLSDYNEIVRHKVLPDANYKFIVGGVPVWVSVGTDLFREVNLQGGGELDFVLGFRNAAELGSGFKWSQTGGMTPVLSASDNFTLVGPTLSGYGKVTGKCWPFYPRINVRFYSLLGPNFDIKPYLQCTLEGGFKLDAGGDSYAGWSLSDEAGLDFKAGLSTYFMNYEAGRWYETNDFTLFGTPLYTSPIDLERTDNNECKVGRKTTLKFGIIDRNDLLGNDAPTVLPQIVTFEGDGEISKKFAVADKGEVTVDWTPKKAGDTMKAVLYGPKGETIKEVTVESARPDAPITGESYDIESNSAKVMGTYSGLFEGCKYGIEYWSSSSAYTVYGSSGMKGGKFTEEFKLEGLKPDTEYHYCAIVECGSDILKGETGTFRTPDGVTCPNDSHVHAIDLGLSVKWACCNVGASCPEEYGGYYAWGETEEKSVYSDVTYKYEHGEHTDEYGNYDSGWDYDNIGSDISDTEYDVAHVKWGGSWRMPTCAEWEELRDNCSNREMTLNGVKGLKLTSKKNGNSIFLPYVGYRSNGIHLYAGDYGYYWSSTHWWDTYYRYDGCAYGAFMKYVINIYEYYRNRSEGLCVRPVCE